MAPGHATVCVSTEAAPEDETIRASPALAFDVHALPEGADLVLVIANARGLHLPAAAMRLALACAEAMLPDVARRAGSVFTLASPAAALSRAIFPDAGARAPAVDGARWAQVAALEDRWVLQAAPGLVSAPPPEAALRAREVAAVMQQGDDALVRGDVDAARHAYLDALERAPSPGMASRIASIDARAQPVGGSVALCLSEVLPAATARLAGVRAELLAALGDPAGAVAAFEQAAESEPAPQLAARALERAAMLLADDNTVAGLAPLRIASDVDLKPLVTGARVIAGTILGRVGVTNLGAPHLGFQIRRAGKKAPLIDAKPILDGWKPFEATAIYRAAALNPIVGQNPTIGGPPRGQGPAPAAGPHRPVDRHLLVRAARHPGRADRPARPGHAPVPLRLGPEGQRDGAALRYFLNLYLRGNKSILLFTDNNFSI